MQNQSMDEHNQDDQLSEITDHLGKNLTLESSFQLEDTCADEDDEHEIVYVIDDNDDVDDDGGGEFEFSFAGEEVKSPVSAEELFDNGKIKPTIPYMVEEAPPVKKVFVVSPTAEEEGPYCVWSTDTAEEATASASSVPEMSRKSNSTGFSRLWRVKDLLVRSNSDGKDTFVFLPGKGTAEAVEKKKKKMMKVVNLTRIKVGGGKSNEGETSSSSKEKEKEKKGKKPSMSVAYEALYGKKKGGDKSYLPYRVGFFTNANGMTKNVHPY